MNSEPGYCQRTLQSKGQAEAITLGLLGDPDLAGMGIDPAKAEKLLVAHITDSRIDTPIGIDAGDFSIIGVDQVMPLSRFRRSTTIIPAEVRSVTTPMPYGSVEVV